MKTNNNNLKDTSNTTPTHSNDSNTSSEYSEEEYEVEKILKCKFKEKTCEKEYLIKWKNFSSSESTWEPEENLNTRMVKNYNKEINLHCKIKRIIDINKIEKENKKNVIVEFYNNTTKTFSFEDAEVFFPIRLVRFYLSRIRKLSTQN